METSPTITPPPSGVHTPAPPAASNPSDTPPPAPERQPQTAPPTVPGRSAPVHDGSATLYAVQSLAYIIVVAIFTITFSLQPFRIPSASMEPTLLVGDFLLVDKQEPQPSSGYDSMVDPFPSSSIHRGDVVVFYYPVDPSLHLVKRVIGLPGDNLRMRNGRVFINGTPLSEPYAIYTDSHEDVYRDNFPHLGSTAPDVDSHWWIQMHRLVDHGELKIPAGQYFVLGDNRNDSEDSRYWGLVPRNSIVGEPFLVYFSLRDPNQQVAFQRDTTSRRPGDPSPTRNWEDAVVDLARWDRVLHVVH